ncbi:alpha/beta fold hydrolase [Paraglaciecola aestuariivivens]
MQPIDYTPEKIVQSNGIKINYDSFGDPSNPPVVLIMGLATQMIFWHQDFCRLLASLGFWVIRFDNRDVGKSAWLTDYPSSTIWQFIAKQVFKRRIKPAYHLKDMAKDTLGLLDALGIAKCHLVGASMGGMIAQIVAIEAPERLYSLTSIMSTTGSRSLPKPAMGFLLSLLTRPPKKPQQQLSHGLKLYKMLHGNHFVFHQKSIETLIEQSISRGVNLAGNNRQFAAILAAPDRTTALQKVSLPTLVIHGENDPLISVEAGHATADAIAGSKLKTFKGMGHTIPTELNHEICQLIASHCKLAQN